MRIESNAVKVNQKIEFGTPKTGETRTVAIPPFLQLALRRAVKGRPESAFVFGTDLDPIPLRAQSTLGSPAPSRLR